MAESEFIEHCPCPSCGSSDAGGLYTDGSAKCHKCGHKWRPDQIEPSTTEIVPAGGDVTPGLLAYEIRHLPARALLETTCRLWGYGYNAARGVHVANYKDSAGRVVAQKIRTKDKKFGWLGDHSAIGLYGEWLWRDGGKMVIITEGEIDALSVSQAQGNRYPVASLPDGAGSAVKAVQRSLSWLESFERVVLMFDMDEAGREAAVAAAKLLTPGKAYIAHLPAKDPNELLKAGRAQEIIRAAWDAKPWAPSGIVTGEDLARALEVGPDVPIARWPWPELDRRTNGIRRGNIVLLAAGIGAGKTTLCRALVSSLIDQGLKVGVVPLEETIRQFGVGLLGIRAGRNVNIEQGLQELPEALRAELPAIKDRLVFLDDSGDRRDATIFDAVRYMAVGLGCQVVLIDHLTMVLGAAAEADDRRHAERFILELESLTKRTGVVAIVVIHLRKPGDGKAHEEGRRVTMSDIRGSGLVPASAHQVVVYERDQQDADRVGRLRVLKARPVGRTGPADQLEYDEASGRLRPVPMGGVVLPEEELPEVTGPSEKSPDPF